MPGVWSVHFTVSEVLILVLPTLAVILLIWGLVYAGGTHRSKRYRPGRPFHFTPVWFLSVPERLTGKTNDATALPEGRRQQQLPGRPAGAPAAGPVLAAQTEGEQHVGGASDRW